MKHDFSKKKTRREALKNRSKSYQNRSLWNHHLNWKSIFQTSGHLRILWYLFEYYDFKRRWKWFMIAVTKYVQTFQKGNYFECYCHFYELSSSKRSWTFWSLTTNIKTLQLIHLGIRFINLHPKKSMNISETCIHKGSKVKSFNNATLQLISFC